MVARGEVYETEHRGLQSPQPSQCLLYVRNGPAFKPTCRSVELNKVKGESPFPRGGLGYKMDLAPMSGARFLDDA